MFQKVEQHKGSPRRRHRKKESGAGSAHQLEAGNVGYENIEGDLGLFKTLPENSPAVSPGDHDDEEEDGDAHRKPTAVKELEQVGAEIGKIEEEKDAGR